MSGLGELLKIPTKSPSPNPWRSMTLEKRTTILYHLREGASRREACGLARVSEGTLGQVLDLGKTDLEDAEQYGCPMTEQAKFYQDVLFAEARAVREYGKKLDAFADKDSGGDPRNWTAGFTHRERTQPMKYGRHSTIAVQQEQSVKVIFEERGGNAWQQVRETGQQSIESDDVIDTVMSESDEV